MPEQSSVLEQWAPSFCLNCEKQTDYDGWEIGRGGNVALFCGDCGKKKGAVAFKDIQDAAFKAEILASIAMCDEDEEDE